MLMSKLAYALPAPSMTFRGLVFKSLKKVNPEGLTDKLS